MLPEARSIRDVDGASMGTSGGLDYNLTLY